ncbi:hypothetical protein KC19_VG188700 [Ceratodon purpureus]|uniref:Uncharacterized protein n=1 Tax=Ceratodon purpureus TaxID=3225 RepID=A0A8T0HSN6_CERPU|nr:hypothetical protein KC19_VG188700 [Ceratodon purpureus]
MRLKRGYAVYLTQGRLKISLPGEVRGSAYLVETLPLVQVQHLQHKRLPQTGPPTEHQVQAFGHRRSEI